jgi:hypothetical protein
LKFVDNSHPGLLSSIREKKSLTDEIISDLKQALADFKDRWAEANNAAAAPSTSAVRPADASSTQPAPASV